jgi:DNA-binding response OmpR family regulator
MASILLVEDEAPIAALIADHLTRRGHAVTSLDDGERALEWLGVATASAREAPPDLVVLDVMLPRRSGLEVCAWLRRAPLPRQPIVLMLTAKRTDEEAIDGFDAGADDYVRKPFSIGELVRRIDALLALASGRPREPAVVASSLHIDPASRRARVGDVDLQLTPKEFELLAHLAARPGIALRREALLLEVWGYAHSGYARTVDSHVRRLRRKLAEAGCARDPIATVHGFGYRFEAG